MSGVVGRERSFPLGEDAEGNSRAPGARVVASLEPEIFFSIKGENFSRKIHEPWGRSFPNKWGGNVPCEEDFSGTDRYGKTVW